MAIEGDLRFQPDADAVAGRREHQHQFLAGDVFGNPGRMRWPNFANMVSKNRVLRYFFSLTH
jgi:hypothetical protein